jgi:hypothetical protein
MNSTETIEFNTKINTILSRFVFYSCVIVVVVFVLGNVLNIVICMRETIRKEMMGYYNVLISFWNILSLAFPNIHSLLSPVHSRTRSHLDIELLVRLYQLYHSYMHTNVSVDSCLSHYRPILVSCN